MAVRERQGEQREVVVVGSGAGGGIVATRLAEMGRDVLLVESGGYHTAGSFSRFEITANRDLWGPARPAMTRPDGTRPIMLVCGKGVGGTTNINTKVAVRAVDQDYRKWHEATGLQGEDGRPFSATDLEPWYERVEARMQVRERTDWTHGVRVVERGFNALGHELHPVMSYTNEDCESCGSCTTGCPTNAGSTTLNRYIQLAMVRGQLDVAYDSRVVELRTSATGAGRREATGVVLVGPDGLERVVESPVVVVACGALVTPQLLQLSGLDRLGTPSSALIGRHLGTHTARFVYGLFDEIIDGHVVYPITSHCRDFEEDRDGGFVIEAITVANPIALASSLVDDDHRPLYGPALVETMDRYRYLAGLFMMTNDSNVGVVRSTDDQIGEIEVPIPAEDQRRLDEARQLCADVLLAAGASRVVSSGYTSAHAQGSVRMGSDRERSCCDANQELWDVEGLYVGDTSVFPRTLTYNPSLTVMALAERLAAHIDADKAGRLSSRSAA